MGMASLGFSNGPSITFRIDPDSVQWNFKINTTVIDTVGGRVVQVLGATLSDITVMGKYGQNRAAGTDGESWKLAEAFVNRIRQIQEHQSRDATDHGKMHTPATFNYSPKGWRFGVYIKSIVDPGGGAVAHQTGRFSYEYAITLFIVEDRSDDLIAGDLMGKAKNRAIEAYMARISEGIGWRFTKYNGTVPERPTGSLYGKTRFDDQSGPGLGRTRPGL